jgi:hypothetical protein
MPLVRKPRDGSDAAPATPASFDAAVLRTGTGDQRWAAARAAAGQPDGVALLAAALPAERDARVREAILTALSRIASAEAAGAVAACVRSDDASLRTAALDALHAMPTATAVHLPDLLADSDADVRLLSCDLLRDQPEADANRLLCDLLVRETEANVCAAALEVIAETGTVDVLPALERCKARFAANAFLSFSIDAATARIAANSRG